MEQFSIPSDFAIVTNIVNAKFDCHRKGSVHATGSSFALGVPQSIMATSSPIGIRETNRYRLLYCILLDWIGIAGLDWIGSDRQQASNASGIFTTRNVACHSELLFDRRRNISIYSCESIDRSNCWKRSFLLKMMFIGKQYCLMTDPLEGLYWLGVQLKIDCG